MLANYGYNDGSGDFYITIDTDKCAGCGDCVKACPVRVLEMITDESDPFRELPAAAVTDEHRKKIKYSCAQCKPAGYKAAELPCVKSCLPGAIAHSW
jgi:ferredoxin